MQSAYITQNASSCHHCCTCITITGPAAAHTRSGISVKRCIRVKQHQQLTGACQLFLLQSLASSEYLLLQVPICLVPVQYGTITYHPGMTANSTAVSWSPSSCPDNALSSLLCTAASGQRKFYTVEASIMEPLFNEFLDHLYREDTSDGSAANPDDPGLGGVTGTGSVVTGGYKGGKGGQADVWHKHNAIFVLNPSKVGCSDNSRLLSMLPCLLPGCHHAQVHGACGIIQ